MQRLRLLWLFLLLWWQLDLVMYGQCLTAMWLIESQHPGENGEYKRARAYKLVANKFNLSKSSNKLSLHLELAYRWRGKKF